MFWQNTTKLFLESCREVRPKMPLGAGLLGHSWYIRTTMLVDVMTSPWVARPPILGTGACTRKVLVRIAQGLPPAAHSSALNEYVARHKGPTKTLCKFHWRRLEASRPTHANKTALHGNAPQGMGASVSEIHVMRAQR